MALSSQVVAAIRDEIGNDPDFANDTTDFDPAIHLDSLENIYTDTARGNGNVLRTALICWRRRLNSLQSRSFDLTTEGSLLNRNQRIRFIERQIKKLEILVDETYENRNMAIQTLADRIADAQNGIYGGAEF